MKKILVNYQIPKEGLKELINNYDVTFPESMSMSREEVMELIPGYDAMICAGIRMDREMIERAENLKIISNYGVGYNNIDVDYATEKGIVVANTPHSVTEGTAEIAFGLMLSVMRRISECDRKLRQDANFKWGMMYWLGSSLYKKTLGIIGMGRIGRAVARRAVASGMKIIYYNRNKAASEIEESLGAKYVTLEQLLKESDVISINTPLTNETHHLLGKKEFELMKPSAYIVNTARGAVIDEQLLIKYLKERKIAGAGLDVFEKEPIIPQELLELDNVVLTPHIGTETLESRIEIGEEVSQNIIEFFDGKRVNNIVNPEVMEK